MTARRSCLSVPATNEHFQQKAEQSAADMVILDLEDSVAPAAKDRGRELAARALTRFAYAGKLRAVRVNACGSPWCHQDVIAVVTAAGERIKRLEAAVQQCATNSSQVAVIRALQAFRGIGFLSAVTIVAEAGVQDPIAYQPA